MSNVLGYHHLSLSVSDLGKSAEWYQKVLGLEVLPRAQRQLRTPRAVVPPGLVKLVESATRCA